MVSGDFSKFDRLGFGQIGRNGQRRLPLVLFHRTSVKEREGDGGLIGTTKGYTGERGIVLHEEENPRHSYCLIE